MTAMLRRVSRPDRLSLSGIDLEVAPGVHHPAPVLGIGVTALQEAALDALAPGARVLELGTGAGFWALAAARRGLDVTATELPHVPLDPVERQARRLGMRLRLRLRLRLVHGDLFEAVPRERFDAILFNPPFHDANPRTPAETAWCGGQVVRRFLHELPDRLTHSGAAYILLPRAEQRRYASELGRWHVRTLAGRWVPILGRIELLELRVRLSD